MKKIFAFCAVLLVAATAFAQDGAKIYGIKSGTIKTEMDMMGQTITNTTYFDDYGAKQATSMVLFIAMPFQTETVTLAVWPIWLISAV